MDTLNNSMTNSSILNLSPSFNATCCLQHIAKQRVQGLTDDLLKKGKHFILIRNPINILVRYLFLLLKWFFPFISCLSVNQQASAITGWFFFFGCVRPAILWQSCASIILWVGFGRAYLYIQWSLWKGKTTTCHWCCRTSRRSWGIQLVWPWSLVVIKYKTAWIWFHVPLIYDYLISNTYIVL